VPPEEGFSGLGNFQEFVSDSTHAICGVVTLTHP
jgi:hypothetical protein